MKNTKRALSLLLSLMLVLGAVAVGGMSASAELAGNAELSIGRDAVIHNGDIKKSEGTGWSITVNEDENSVTLNLDNLNLELDFGCIYAGNLDLTITGSAKLTTTGDASSAISIHEGNLTLNGDFALSAQGETDGALGGNGNLTVEGGSLSVISTGNDNAIELGGKMTVNGGSVYAKTESGSDIHGAIFTGLGLTLNNGEAFALGDWNAKEALISALKGSGVSDSPYEISNYGGLKEFSSIVNGTNVAIAQNTAACAKLMKDIECKYNPDDEEYATDWTPIGNLSNQYTGTFDGDGYVITGLSTPADYNSNYVGLFGCVGTKTEGGVTTKGTVKNVGLEGINIIGNDFTGGVVGENKGGTVSHCYSTGSVKGSGNDAGGVVGANYDGTVTNCYSAGNVSGSSYTGGVVGHNKGGTVTSCYSTGDVTGSNMFTGGVVGLNYDGTVTNCYSNATVKGSGNYTGGVAGYNTGGTVTNCYSAGDVTGDGMNTGGVVGQNNGGTVTNCYSAGSVTGSGNFTGGVAGYNMDNGRVTNCYSAGNVSGSGYTGGVVGYNIDGRVTNCYSAGNVSGSSYTGGVAGYNTDNSEVTNCYSAGSVTGNDFTGGVVGQNYYGTVTNCYSAGSVSGSRYTGGVAGRNLGSTITNCYYDKSVCGNIGAVSDADDASNVKGLTTAQMTGENALSNMTGFSDTDWLTKADGADVSGKYFLFYPHLKGFDYDLTAASEDWPAKVEVSATWSGEDSYTYNGQAQMPSVTSVTIGDTSVPEGASVTYFKNAYSGENAWGWADISNTPTEPGKYKMEISSGDEVLETKYFSILDPGTDYTVSYYKKTVEEWKSVTPVEAGKYKAVITFSETGSAAGHAPIEKVFVINPASVTLTANSGTENYDGTEKTVSGFTSSVEGLTFNGVTASGSGTNAGAYAVTFSGVTINETRDATGNYIVTGTENGTLKIDPASVTLTANSGTENYDGTEKTVSGFTSSVEGLTFDGVTASGSGTEPGVYDVTFSGVTENETRDNTGNYVVTGTADGTLTVNPVIKFVNEDGTELQSSAVALGETPEYKGEPPVKAKTDEATYTFKGWSPEITAAEGNATYTATFTETKKEKPADDKPAAKAAIAIKGEDALTLGYKQNKTFTADTEGVPEGGKVQWYLNGEKAGEGKTFKVENPEEDYTVQSKIVDASGNTVAESETVKVTVKHGFFDKLKAWLTDLLLGVFAPLFSKFEEVC